jgi:hypothetical protein
MVDQNILKHFGVDESVFLEALKLSPSAQGYIAGAISEVLLKDHLEAKGYEVIRIKEKPSGGNKAKNYEARGDFYIRKQGNKSDEWLVIESKGLKSNSEFRGSKLDSPEKVFRFLKTRVFNKAKTKDTIYKKGYSTYSKAKEKWERKNKGEKFPKFGWTKEFPGPECYELDDIWKSEEDLKKWVDTLNKDSFTEQAYRNVEGAIAILETHQPSKRVGIKTGIDQAAPLVYDFNIMSVDLFLRTGKHEFVFMNSEEIAHSPTSPEHLYQNYIIDILVKDKKNKPIIQRPWYSDIEDCISTSKPAYRPIDRTQIDNR